MKFLISNKIIKYIFLIFTLIMFFGTIILSIIIYKSIINESWSLFSTVHLRTIILIYSIISTMIYSLGIINIIKFNEQWQKIFTYFLLIPIILSIILYYFSINIPKYTKFMYNVANNAELFFNEKMKISVELSKLPNFNNINECYNCSFLDFNQCINCSIFYNSNLILNSSKNSFKIFLLSFIYFLLNLLFNIFIEIKN